MPKRTAHDRVQPAVQGGDSDGADEAFPEELVVDDSSDTGEELDSQSESDGDDLGPGLSGVLGLKPLPLAE